MSQSITAKQLEVLRCISDHVHNLGYPPTVREICQTVGLSSTSTVHGYLQRLQNRGFIQRDPTKPRTLEITKSGRQALGLTQEQIPMLGVVTAGAPILALQEQASDFFPLPPNLKVTDQNLFMLTIQGDSMINAGILDGDAVIVRQQATAENGEIVIAMNADNEATCKRFFKEAHQIRLQPENEAYEPIILPNVQILGKVVALYRATIN